jgi:hypothetical protein
VEDALKSERWSGCRGALRDYFSDRVERERQWAYLMTVQTWFAGGIGTPRGFLKLDTAKQRLAIASAVNEIMQLSPADEKKRFASSYGIAGNAATLRTSIEFHIRRLEDGRGRSNGKTQPKAGPSYIGSNQPEFYPEEIEYMKEHGISIDAYREGER